MARTFRRKESMTAVSEINVAPLIDLAFALLIIFMITTPLLEQSISIELPLESKSPQSAKDDLEFQVISIDKAGAIYWGEEAVSLDELKRLLEDAALQTEPPVLNIRAHGGLPYQNVIDVIDVIKKSELTKISLDTQVR